MPQAPGLELAGGDEQSDAAVASLEITVCHLPSGTSQENKIEHRLFSHITMNWRCRPLTSHEVMLQTIAATTSRTGLTVHAELDSGQYPTGIRVSGDQRRRVQAIIHGRLADDREPQECRYLTRFWWQLGRPYQEVSLAQLSLNVRKSKLDVLERLISISWRTCPARPSQLASVEGERSLRNVART